MIRGWYTAASGMRAQQWRLDAVANNLANVNTDGYKRDVAAFKAFPELLIRRQDDDGVYQHPFGSADAAPIVGKMGTGVELNELYTAFEQGSFKETQNDFDIALDGKVFLPFPRPGASAIPAMALSSLAKKVTLKPKKVIRYLGNTVR